VQEVVSSNLTAPTILSQGIEGEACPHRPFWKGRDRYAALD
jgi:hypothetical protein